MRANPLNSMREPTPYQYVRCLEECRSTYRHGDPIVLYNIDDYCKQKCEHLLRFKP